jgi:exo-1,4-beta-D-glucosaminidase
MKTWIDCVAFVLSLCLAVNFAAAAVTSGPGSRIDLQEGWYIQSSNKVEAGGESISVAAFRPEGWYPATMPSTVLAALVANNVYPDPYFGMNLRSIPGTAYPVGSNFSNIAMPADSPFAVSWWYRKAFPLRAAAGEHVWLNFDGVNYKANVWFNGKLIADTTKVAGAYRIYEFEVTDLVRADVPNALAVEVFAPTPSDLALNWVDWNPMPPDKDMGIWRDVYVTVSGPVALRYPLITSKLDIPSLAEARLTIAADLRNASAQPVRATLKAEIEQAWISRNIDLGPRETKKITLTADDFAQLRIRNPRVWWPNLTGPQNLYNVRLEVVTGTGKISDAETLRFGIRDVSSELTDKGYRLFKINGKPILIRGGGWAPDMMLRSSAEREQAEIRYVKEMNLNTIRFEGKTESRRFLELCDREGILVIAGWCCCDLWEQWKKWDGEDLDIAVESLRDQLRRIRNHPSVLAWWYGSDNPPPANVAERYIATLKEVWPYPYQSSATAKPADLGEPTGLKMTGPYEYVPPMYWLTDTKNGGAYGFNTETGPGPAVPPVDSLRRMLPKDHMWPIDEFWNYHAGGGVFKTLKVFTDAMNKRYGAAGGVEDYALKSQAIAYDGERAMFEAYARNKYTSTGVIQWMTNNAWPSLIWHLYDYYLRPAGGYFGTRKACEPIHIQYSYDDNSIAVVNGTYQELRGLKATAQVYNLDMTEKFSRQATLDMPPDGVVRVFTLPQISGLSTTYFLRLSLANDSGQELSTNFYWLSTKPDTLNDEKAEWYYTPQRSFADLTGLASLPKADLNVSAKGETKGTEQVVRIALENPGRSLGFLVRLKVTSGKGGEEVLPIYYQDNYFPLLPGEKKEVTATFAAREVRGSAPFVEVEGWNVVPKSVAVTR